MFFHGQTALKAPDRHTELRVQIHEIFTDAKERYGHRRIHAALARRGYSVAKKTVLKLMRQENLVGKVRKRSISRRAGRGTCCSRTEHDGGSRHWSGPTIV